MTRKKESQLSNGRVCPVCPFVRKLTKPVIYSRAVYQLKIIGELAENFRSQSRNIIVSILRFRMWKKSQLANLFQ